MVEIFIVVILLVLFFFVIQKYVIRHDDTKDYAYKKKGPLLDMKESAFFNALVSAVGDHGVVLAKVNMTNVITPSKVANKSTGLLLITRSQKATLTLWCAMQERLNPESCSNWMMGKSCKRAK